MKKYFVMCVGTLAMMLTACKSHQSVTTTAFHNYTTECLGKSMDGSQTLRVWATGRNRADAIEQAKKKAVFDVTFNSISLIDNNKNSAKYHMDWKDINRYTNFLTQLYLSINVCKMLLLRKPTKPNTDNSIAVKNINN